MYPRASRVGLNVHLDPEGDPSGNEGDKKAKKTTGFRPDMSDEEIEASIAPHVAKGDYRKVAIVYRRDNAKVRELNRKANEALDTRTELSKEDSELLTAAKKAKLTAEALQAVLTENKTMKATVAETEFDKEVEKAAKAMGVNAKVLKDQLKLNEQVLENRDVHVEVEDPKNKGQKVVELRTMPHVRPAKDEKAPLTAASVWAKTLAPEYQTALKAGSSTAKEDKKTTSSFTEFPEQPSGDKAPTQARAVDNHMRAMYGTLPAIPGVVTPKPATQGA